MRLRVAHLYPDYLNIYADRGNIAVFERRAALRGHSLEITGVAPGDSVRAVGVRFDLRRRRARIASRRLIAPDLAARGDRDLRRRRRGNGAARGLRRLPAARPRLPRPGRIDDAGRRRSSRTDGRGRQTADRRRAPRRRSRRYHDDGGRLRESRRAARSSIAGATPLGRVVAGHGNDGTSGYEGCRVAAAVGTYLHGPLLPRNPALADWLLGRALEHAGGDGELEPLPDELERLAHAVSAGRARSRGGR